MTDFWSKRTGATPGTYTPPSTPAQLPPQFQQAAPMAPSYGVPQLPPTPEQSGASQAPRQAASARQHDLCPGCGSGNYLAPPGGGRARCYDCGYPIEQSTSGVTGTSQGGGAAQPAQQASGYSGGFQPNVIVNK